MADEKRGPEPIYYQLLEFDIGDGQRIEYSDCVEVSLLSLLRYLAADELRQSPAPTACQSRLRALTSDEAILDWFARYASIEADAFYRVPRRCDFRAPPDGVAQRVAWSLLLGNRRPLVYNFDGATPPRRHAGNPPAAPGTYELRACVQGFLQLMQHVFPGAALDTSYGEDDYEPARFQAQLDRLSAFLTKPDRPVRFAVETHARHCSDDYECRATVINIHAAEQDPLYKWTLTELHRDGDRNSGHSDFRYWAAGSPSDEED